MKKHLLLLLLITINQTCISQTAAISKGNEEIQFKTSGVSSDLRISIGETPDSSRVGYPITFTPIIEGENLESEMYLKCWNTNDGYLKLKFGYDSENIYGQEQNVISGGNDTLEITIKAFSENVNWSKIQLRPSAKGSLTLDEYINIGSISDGWVTLNIPLIDFEESIDFSFISYLELPYSADAGNFEIGIKKILFKGGATPFEWFGQNHFDNSHDGSGTGQLNAELIIPDEDPLTAVSLSLIANGVVISSSSERPFNFEYLRADTATVNFKISLTDNLNKNALSNTRSIKFFELNTEDFSTVRLVFDSDPGDLSIELAPLKYNKEFAYSITLDDGKIDVYSHMFKLFNGGYIEETGENFEGLFYSDGCGNPITFKGSTAWNSVSASYIDIHLDTPDYMTWENLKEISEAGWGVLNHSYSHNAYSGTDYAYEISENQVVVQDKVNYIMKHFVIPSGDIGYADPAFNYGMKVVYSNKTDFLGYNSGIDLDPPFNLENNRLYRRILKDEFFDRSNIMEKIDEIASASNNENHMWYHDFSHRILTTPYSESLTWNTFKYYMLTIAEKYGLQGSDKIWVASPTEIFDYLESRENIEFYTTKNGNEVFIHFNTNLLPTDIEEYAISLNIKTNANLTEVLPQFTTDYSFANTSSTQKLINLKWTNNSNSATSIHEIEEYRDFSIYPNPIIGSLLNVRLNNSSSNVYNFNLMNLSGQTLFNQSTRTFDGNTNFQFKLPSIAPGVYFLIIDDNNNVVQTEKIIIQ